MTQLRGLIGSLALVAVLVLGGCPGDDAEVALPPGLQQGIEDGMSNLLACIGGLDPLLEVARDPSKAGGLGISYAEVQGQQYAYDFEVPIDIDWDEIPDASLEGRIVFSEDPADGIAPGSTASLTWTLMDQGAGVGGSGTLDLEFQADGTIKVIGAGTIDETGGDGSFNFVLPASDPLFLTLAGAGLTSQLQALGPLGCALLAFASGSFDVTIWFSGHTFTGTVSSSAGSTWVDVTNGEWDGSALPDFSIDLCPPPTGDPWTGSWLLEWDCGDGDTGTSTQTVGRKLRSDNDYDYYSVQNQSKFGTNIFTLQVHRNDPAYPAVASYTTEYLADASIGLWIRETATWTMGSGGQSFHKESDWEHIDFEGVGHCSGEATKLQ
jgi:hypothetical protein